MEYNPIVAQKSGLKTMTPREMAEAWLAGNFAEVCSTQQLKRTHALHLTCSTMHPRMQHVHSKHRMGAGWPLCPGMQSAIQ